MIAGPLSLLLHLLASLSFVGIIWYVQLISYPQMRNVNVHDWKVYEAEHTKRSFWLIAPLFVMETIGTVGISIYYWDAMPKHVLINAAMFAVAYGVTFAVHMPLHRLLSTSHQTKWIEALNSKNWWRTLAWTVKGIVALSMTAHLLF